MLTRIDIVRFWFFLRSLLSLFGFILSRIGEMSVRFWTIETNIPSIPEWIGQLP